MSSAGIEQNGHVLKSLHFPVIHFRLQSYQFPGSIVSCDVAAIKAVFPQSKENSHEEECSDGATHMRCNYEPRVKLLIFTSERMQSDNAQIRMSRL